MTDQTKWSGFVFVDDDTKFEDQAVLEEAGKTAALVAIDAEGYEATDEPTVEWIQVRNAYHFGRDTLGLPENLTDDDWMLRYSVHCQPRQVQNPELVARLEAERARPRASWKTR